MCLPALDSILFHQTNFAFDNDFISRIVIEVDRIVSIDRKIPTQHLGIYGSAETATSINGYITIRGKDRPIENNISATCDRTALNIGRSSFHDYKITLIIARTQSITIKVSRVIRIDGKAFAIPNVQRDTRGVVGRVLV